MTFKIAVEKAKGYLMTRRMRYLKVFDNTNGEFVLADLAKFCRANQSTAHGDPQVAARLDGRREVWLRIQHHLKLSPDDLWKLYSGLDDKG